MTQVTIVKVEKEKSPKGYEVTQVAYKTADGKMKGLKIYPFGEQESVAAAFDTATPGDVYDVQFQKNAKGFWELAPTPTKTGAKMATTTAGTSKGGWETSEERAARQVMIVRQSSLSTAVAFHAANGAKFTTEDVKKAAKIFEEFVLATPTKDIE